MKISKKGLLIVSLLTSAAAMSQEGIKILGDEIPVEATKKYFAYANLESKVKTGDNISKNQSIGSVKPFPQIRSQRFERELTSSENFYNKQDFENAAKVLEIPYQEEKENLFVMNAYARALYQLDSIHKEKSFEVYKNLITRLDLLFGKSDSVISISMWFPEAYWKLGTLYMDHAQWEKAMIEIGRMMAAYQGPKDSDIYDQALSYLTECAYELKNRQLCLFFGERALHYNPHNIYVKPFMDKLKYAR